MTDKIDWKSAPEGATHYNHESKQFFAQVCENIMTYCNGTWTRIEGYTIADIESAAATVKRPESITDVARSIEAARVEERKHGHYFKDVSSIAQIDVYSVLRLFEVTDPCLQHIVKKALCAGKRGAKDFARDVQEIADTAARLIELESGK